MNNFPANCPGWLLKRIDDKGGNISFYDYMDITLNDPINGYYGSGKAKLGIGGDFVTSPSMSNEFAILLSEQIRDWLEQLSRYYEASEKFTILEFGAGDGSFMKDLIDCFFINNKDLLNKISFLIVETNLGMLKKQKVNLKKFLDLGIDITWSDLKQIHNNSINGIVIAHELLDAFPVERIEYYKGDLFQQGVSLDSSKKKLMLSKFPLTQEIKSYLLKINNVFDIKIPPNDLSEGWTSELHLDNSAWLNNVYDKINNGLLLVIDYAIEANKYYSKKRQNGMLLSYRNQVASTDILQNPGDCDLTSHICSDILIKEALLTGFEFIGLVKQGEALLSLGLAEKLYEIQLDTNIDLSAALKKRESLLRLVDPLCLGDFKWFVFQKFIKKDLKIFTKSIS